MEGDESVFDEILKRLPSYEAYSKFNSDINLTKNSICKEENYAKCVDKVACTNLCKKIERNFKYLSEISKSKDYNSHCLNHTYWVNEEIRNLFKSGSSNNIEDIVKEFVRLGSFLSTNYRINNCNYFVHKSLEKLNNRKKEKYLYDYFTNYSIIKSKNTCTDVSINKYKSYINAISKLYEDKKSSCCWNNASFCPHYFLKCDDEYKPNNLLSALRSTGMENCDGLESLRKTKTVEKELHSKFFEEEFLDSILFTTCNINKESRDLPCSLVSASYLTRNMNVVENSEEQRNNERFSGGKKAEYSVIPEVVEQHEEIRKKAGLISSETINNMISPPKGKQIDLRWKLDAEGKLHCPTKKSKGDTLGLWRYVEELVKRDILMKEANSEVYRLKEGKTWPTQALNIFVKRIGENESAERYSGRIQVLNSNQITFSDDKNSFDQENIGKYTESNILQNTFVRISIVTALVMGIIFVLFFYVKFTPFGSCIGKARKRKKRYRNNFSELSTQRFPRRFIKRTYRNSERRRFSVVNIQE
ncbi:PIR Superfamily Protein [Plasmodium malariae]|uniref:PIR Superfamily Protein n=1 Tax=Plasmodium malariae TaxID=5858 RepID=A0A1A8XCQ5_PLAMA|nr:PIR Superfamily Protein [Plasmodium malariae]